VVATEYILHSTVQAGNVVRVIKSPDGFINGGLIRAGNAVWAPILGSEMSESRTSIEVGVGFNVRKEYDTLQANIEQNKANFDKLAKNIRVLQAQLESNKLPGEKLDLFNKMHKSALDIRDQMYENYQDHHRLFLSISEDSDLGGYIFAPTSANSGTKIQIKRFKTNLTSTLEGCAFRIINGELKTTEFSQAQRHFKSEHGKIPD